MVVRDSGLYTRIPLAGKGCEEIQSCFFQRKRARERSPHSSGMRSPREFFAREFGARIARDGSEINYFKRSGAKQNALGCGWVSMSRSPLRAARHIPESFESASRLAASCGFLNRKRH